MRTDDSLHPNKRDSYTPDPIPDSIYVASKDSIITFATRGDYPQITFLTPYAPKTYHTTTINKHYCGNIKMGYCAMNHDGIRSYFKNSSYLYGCSIHKGFCYCTIFMSLIGVTAGGVFRQINSI